ncbi:MAG TPA: Holliday junction branch migration protein RuvA [Candidatus Saccharimonadales bacterium]|nr:Holliday junction branch migration protein RuvA [Candidatus Saccharimonadales bacterium]
MIAHVSGEVVEKTSDAVIIDVGGIGYEIQVATGDFELAQLGKEIKLHTYDYLRENSHDLFGFSSLAAKRLFELLISVSGVGPRMALAVLSLGDVEMLRSALATADSPYVQRASGVGKRLAERITVDLKDKVGVPTASVSSHSGQQDDALEALLALGYSLQQANEALKDVDPSLGVQAKVKHALQKGIG